MTVNNEHNWENSNGDSCPRCAKPALRFYNGICLPCNARAIVAAERKERNRQRFLHSMRAHNARVDKRNKGGPIGVGPPNEPM